MRKYQLGGKVKISGRWYRITGVGTDAGEDYEIIQTNEGLITLTREFVEAYIKPESLDFFNFACMVEDYMNGKLDNKDKILGLIEMFKENKKL